MKSENDKKTLFMYVFNVLAYEGYLDIIKTQLTIQDSLKLQYEGIIE